MSHLSSRSVSSITLPPLSDIRASLYQASLPDFISAAWPLVEPATSLSWNWHLDELCKVLTAISEGTIKRIIINIPPGSMKSLCLTLWAAWEWSKKPSTSYLTASYTDDNTIRDNRRLKAIVTSSWYQDSFWSARMRPDRIPVTLSSDQSAKVRFDNTARGWRIASSVGGVGTGEHPDRIIIDDPHKAIDARSTTSLLACQDWMDKTILTRIMKDPAIIVVMQRLHMEDLTGHLLRKGGWDHICFPMRYEIKPIHSNTDHSVPDPRDHRTNPGELLWPDRWPEDKVRQEELDLGPFGASAQLQQQPIPEGGGLFKREWFEIVDAAPIDATRCRGWDTASTPGAGDYTAGVRLALTDSGIVYVENVFCSQLGPSGVDAVMKQKAVSDGKACAIREEKEGGSSGKAVIAARVRTLRGYDYAGVTISGDKVTRVGPFRAQCEAGNVKIVRGDWNEDYITELCAFPVGKFDDRVDGSSCAYNALIEIVEAKSRKSKKATWGKRSKDRDRDRGRR